MSVARTARRRRQQALNGYRHLAKRQRPKYARPDADAAQRRNAAANKRRAELIARGVKVK